MGFRTKWQRGDRFLMVHRDQDIVVVDKSAPLLTVGTPPKAREQRREENLMTLLGQFLGAGRKKRLYPVQRLDRPVSGLLVFALHPEAKEGLVEQFAAHDVERRYLAAVQGIIEDEEGTFESRLESDPRSLRMYSSRSDTAKWAVTHWRVAERLEAKNVTLIEVELETGLRNQIRVHFSEAGHPLLGEKKYLRPDEGGDSMQGKQRIFLHAARLGFEHPRDGRWMYFESELPPDLQRWLRGIRGER